MKNDGIVLEGKGAVIDLSDADYEVLSTTADGPLESVREIRINHHEPDYSNGVLNLHSLLPRRQLNREMRRG